MAGVTLTIERVGTNSYTYSWSGTGPYDIYLNGELFPPADGVLPTTDTSITIASSDSEEPEPIEVIDTSGTTVADNSTYPPFVIIQWRGQGEAVVSYYKVEQYISAAWETVDNVQETDAGWYTYESQTLADVTSHQFRVTAIDIEGTESQVRATTVTMARNPAAPVISGSYSDPNLTISAR